MKENSAGNADNNKATDKSNNTESKQQQLKMQSEIVRSSSKEK